MGQALAQDLPQLNLKSNIQTQIQPKKLQGHLNLTLELAWRFWSLLHKVKSWSMLHKEHNSTQSPFLFVLVMSVFYYIIKIWRVVKIRLLKFMFICLLISVITMDGLKFCWNWVGFELGKCFSLKLKLGYSTFWNKSQVN